MTDIVKVAGVTLKHDQNILTLEIDKEGRVVTPGQLLEFCNYAIEHVMAWFAGDPGATKCKGCNADILWVTTKKNGKPTPVNVKMQNYITKEGDYKVGMVPHWATCGKAKDFKSSAIVCRR